MELMGLSMFGLMLYSLLLKNNHILLSLLSLEGMMLAIFMMLELVMNMNVLTTTNLLMFMAIMVCESALGLGLLVSMVRSNGNDMSNMSLWL